MNITYCRDYPGMSKLAASFVLSEIESKKDLLFCAATGHSPEGLYRELEKRSNSDPSFFANLRIIKLDEWGGIPENHPSTCEVYLRKSILEPLDIPSGNYISFSSDPSDPVQECNRVQCELDQQGPIDLCILGLGTNGHLGLNEPGANLEPHCHAAELSPSSLHHGMLQSMKIKPRYGLTLGMQDILSSRKILLLVSGNNKESIIEKFLKKEVTTHLPASYLWLHNDVECLIDQTSFQ